MFYKRQMRKINFVSEDQHLFFNMKHSVGIEHWWFSMFYYYEKRGGMLRLDFPDSSLLRGRLLGFSSL
jgi:hypothetical protein